MLVPTRTTAPAADLLSLNEAKKQVNAMEFGDDDDLLTSLIAAATQYLDGFSGVLGRCLINQGWLAPYSNWGNCGKIELPFPQVSTVTVKYSDADDVEQTLDTASYQLLESGAGSFLFLRPLFTYPSLFPYRGDPVRVTLTAGYGASASDVPQPIRTAALLLVAHWYANREAAVVDSRAAAVEVPFAVEALIAPYRRPHF